MRGIRIEDGTRADPTLSLGPGDVGCLAFDLVDILRVLGERGRRSSWRIDDDLDCFGESEGAIAALADAGGTVPGDRFTELASRLTQVIDGDFAGYEAGQSAPWIVVKAIDSSWWEVWTDDASVLRDLRSRFRAVSDIDESAA